VAERSVGVRDAKARPSEILRDVGRGAEWIVTDRGRPIARIVPVGASDLPLAERLRRLGAQRVLGPRAQGLALPPPLPVPHDAAQLLLDQERGR
jgi:prevent-host-death family protein